MNINDVLAFLIELIALASFGYLGTMVSSARPMKVIGALVSLGIIMAIWGNLFAPKALHRLEMPWIFMGKLIILLLPSYIWFYKKYFSLAVIWAIIVLFHLVLSVIQKKI